MSLCLQRKESDLWHLNSTHFFYVSVLGLSMSSVLVNMSYPNPQASRSCPPLHCSNTQLPVQPNIFVPCGKLGEVNRQRSLVNYQNSDRPEHEFTENRQGSRPVEEGKKCDIRQWCSKVKISRPRPSFGFQSAALQVRQSFSSFSFLLRLLSFL